MSLYDIIFPWFHNKININNRKLKVLIKFTLIGTLVKHTNFRIYLLIKVTRIQCIVYREKTKRLTQFYIFFLYNLYV